MASYPYAELHAFPDGDTPHSGNPAGVMLLDEMLPDGDLLGLAQSNNLSETAYLVPEGPDHWHLRWFTPGHEVDLCGHATLASAVWLFEEGHVTGERVHFRTLSGELTVARQTDQYVMDFPEVGFIETAPDPVIQSAMSDVEPEATFEIERVHGSRYLLLVYADEMVVAGMTPKAGPLEAEKTNVLVTAPGHETDFVSRFFAPAAGIFEDPVTGSAHCTLAPYWAGELGLSEMTARQIGPRPGALKVRTGAGGRVELIGTARRFLDGTIRI